MDLRAAYEAALSSGQLRPDPAQAAAVAALDRVAQDLSAAPQPRRLFRKPKLTPQRGLYLWGGVGRGKSMLMNLLYDTVSQPKDRLHFHAFMQWAHAEMATAREQGVEDAIAPVADKLAARVRFLAFDEMQITDITDAMIVGRLFEALFAAGVMIVTTANRPPDDLYKDGLNRQLFLPFIALLKDRMEVHELISPTDYRQDRLRNAESYFTPVDGAARVAIDALWDGFSQGGAAPLVLHVKGREVVIPAFAAGVARAGFFDLCGQALGPGDYLALAEAVRVLILEDIPVLSRHNFNEAKRFVTLIDALYEARVRLICSAAAAPEMLYVEGTGTFEFERTASRLREMQSADWAG